MRVATSLQQAIVKSPGPIDGRRCDAVKVLVGQLIEVPEFGQLFGAKRAGNVLVNQEPTATGSFIV